MPYNDTIPPGKAKGCLPRTTRFAQKCLAFSDSIEVIPRAKWADLIPKQPGLRECVTEIFDQDGVGSCATEATTQAVQIARAFAGRQWVQLNPWYLYHTTSGGRDNGSSIDENLEFARESGIAPMEVWPRENGWKATPSAEAVDAAKDYRLDEYFDIGSIEEFGTALLLGMPVVYGRKGHALCAVRLQDKNTILYANSWDASWGDRGFGEDALSSVNFKYGAFAVRTVVDAT